MLVVSNIEAAKAQLELAIERYNESDWVAAITLAGAAEGCLLKGGEDLFSKVLDAADARGCGKKEIIERLNRTRNWLKHSGEQEPRVIEIVRTDAALMIVRAMTRFYAATGEQTSAMDSFEQSFRESYPEFEEGLRE